MTIDWKKPKYILPLIFFPFLLIFYYVLSSWKTGPKKSAEALLIDSINQSKSGQINPDMPGVSSQVAKKDLKDKFESYQDAYKNKKDFSAINSVALDRDSTAGGEINSSYSSADVERLQAAARLDSLRKVLNSNKAAMNDRMKNLMNGQPEKRTYPQRPKTPEQILSELQRQKEQLDRQAAGSGRSATSDPMSLFREQIRVMDSLSKANKLNGQSPTGKTPSQDAKFLPGKDTSFKPLPVSLDRRESTGFNTLRQVSAEHNIKAMIDQDEKGFVGTRVRLRLLDDIYVGDTRVSKGTYLYAFITGFQSQRVSLSVTQVVVDNNTLPVKLDIFDADGYYGLYVPGSNFREFTKDIGTQGTSGLSSVQMSGGGSDITAGLISKMFSTSGNAINRMIRKDKAFLKYNYMIYLKEKK